MDAATYYIWVGGSCDYAHEERSARWRPDLLEK